MIAPVRETAATGVDPTVELSENVAHVARTLFAAGNVADTLKAIVDLAVDSIEGCESAGIVVSDTTTANAAVSSDALAAAIDLAQLRLDEGPCMEAIAGGVVVYAGDLLDEQRWPRLAAEASAMGLRSTLALRLEGDGAFGALGLYSHFPLAFGIADRAKALIFATIAGLALAAAHLHDNDARLVEGLHQALSTRELIGQAQGILMERERITANQAFDILRVASQHLNVKLREVARELVDTGETPLGEPPTRPQ
ncbi:MAG TPA: GAF and ANTAR domain-containing protein [Acidimicrobiales bacterium]|nr:GAF and ANTAR domain-containing protein [Acidimicrobiales bacterium]